VAAQESGRPRDQGVHDPATTLVDSRAPLGRTTSVTPE
jgi:hypothetical protein